MSKERKIKQRIYKGFVFKLRSGYFEGKVVHDEIMKEEYYRIPENPKVVIDVGAHVGGTAILCASLGATVYAYEPMQSTFDILLDNIVLNKAKITGKIYCFDKAIGTPCQRKLYHHSTNSGASSLWLFTKGTDKEDWEMVDVISLKQVFEENNIKHCDLLKLDCEGAEFEILYDTPKEVFDKIGQISLEWHYKDKENIVKLVKFLSQFYRVDKPTRGYMLFCYKK
ncbi:unnamed protein product [marine sediment metagenome]|uniref:Methyltransferase FkbM domain-containing protein n=1 Tax=marine sediment metagenome TaxID=412755 RepID=X1BVF5_9ZZZZ